MPTPIVGLLNGTGEPIGANARAPMERAFGADFGAVRVHTDANAARASRALGAEAFTRGQDVFFGAGRYRPETREGRRLLAHELTHTVQQRGTSSGAAAIALTEPRDPFEQEADAIAGRVVAGERIGSHAISRVARASVQRDVLDDLWEGAQDVGSAAWDVAEEVGGAIGGAAEWAIDRVALAAVRQLIRRWGGDIRFRRGCLEVTIPSIPLLSSFNSTLGKSPLYPFFVPFLEGGAMIGPVPVAGAFGFLATAQASLEAAVGPLEIRDIRFQVCPFSGDATGSGRLYGAAAIGGRLDLFGGLAGVGFAVIPVTPPIPIIAILQGGLRGIGTIWGIGAIDNHGSVRFSVGSGLQFRNTTDLMAGVLLEGNLDAYAALRLYDKVVCQYAYRLGQWATGAGWRLRIPARLDIDLSGISGGIGPITWGRVPIEAIETVIKPPPTGLDCLSWDELKGYLCEQEILPPSLCPVEDPGGESLAPTAKQCGMSRSPTPSGRVAITKGPFAGTTVHYEDPRGKHTKVADCSVSELGKAAKGSSAKFRGELKRFVQACETRNTGYGSQVGAVAASNSAYENLVKTALENGTPRGGKFHHKAGHDIGVDVTTRGATPKYRVDLSSSGHGAHVIPLA